MKAITVGRHEQWWYFFLNMLPFCDATIKGTVGLKGLSRVFKCLFSSLPSKTKFGNLLDDDKKITIDE